MKAVEIPDNLANLVQASGADLNSFVVQAIEEKLSHRLPLQGKNMAQMIGLGWKPPIVHGKPRDDGVPWSEIETPCDPA